MSSSAHPAMRLYHTLQARGLTLSVRGNELFVIPAGHLSPIERERIRAWKSDLVTLVNSPHDADDHQPRVYGCPLCRALIPWGSTHVCPRQIPTTVDGASIWARERAHE